jgi:hypothetical protein
MDFLQAPQCLRIFTKFSSLIIIYFSYRVRISLGVLLPIMIIGISIEIKRNNAIMINTEVIVIPPHTIVITLFRGVRVIIFKVTTDSIKETADIITD